MSSHIKAYAERIERLHDERDTLAQDLAELYAEAKDHDIDVKVMKAAIAHRRRVKKDPEGAAELEAKVHQYLFEIEGGPVPAKEDRARAPATARAERAPTDHSPAPSAPQSTAPVRQEDASRQEAAPAAAPAAEIDLSIPEFLDRRTWPEAGA